MLRNSQKFLWNVALGAAVAFAWGCGGSSTPANPITVSIAPTTPTVLVNGTVQFLAQVVGSNDRSVTWTVNDQPAGDTMTAVGKISTDGLYTAPAKVPNPIPTITVKATANADKKTVGSTTITLDSGIRVTVVPATATVGTGETFKFTAIVSNDPTNSVTWSVKDNVGSITPIPNTNVGAYTAPGSVSTATATVIATSTIDSARTGSATVTIVTAQQPTFSGISPKTAPQGGLFQDVYLNATNLRSTSVVKFKGQPVDAGSQLTIISDKLARLRLIASDLKDSGPFPIFIEGAPAPDTFNIEVVGVRPAIVEAFPDSVPQTPTSPSITINGGYFGTADSPVVSAQFNGTIRKTSIKSPRQLTLDLNPDDLSSDIIKPGLYPIAVKKNISIGSNLIATTNLAVQPTAAPTISGALLSMGAGSKPSSVAIDTVLGKAIVTNNGTNSVQLLTVDSTTPVPTLKFSCSSAPPCPIGGFSAPVSVAVDELRHNAFVVNSGDKTVSMVDLNAGAVTIPFDLKAIFGGQNAPTPVAIGVEPNSGLALVVYRSTNTASILNIDKNKSPAPACLFGGPALCVVGQVTISTGTSPQVAIDPRLKWAFVTRGALGPLSVVDLNQPASSVDIAADGAKRASNVVTITTKTPHGLSSSFPTSVAITGVRDPSFNGTVSVTASTSTTFSFTQSPGGPDVTSGDGQIRFGGPLFTIPVGNTLSGVAINPFTSRAIFTDLNSGSMGLISELDQSVTSVDIGHPASAAAFNPFTNVAVVVKPNSVGAAGDTLSLIDPTRTFINPAAPDKPGFIAEINTGGTGSSAVAVDPGTNFAIVANSTSDNVSFISLGPIKPVHISQLIIKDPTRQLIPNFALASTADLPVTITGKGFSGGTIKVRLDGMEIASLSLPPANDRQFDVNIPASSPLFRDFSLNKPKRYSLEIVKGADNSNSIDFTVVKAVAMTATGCGAPNPSAVAIDADRDLAVVANTGCNSISLVDLNTGAVTGDQISVGTSPEGVAVLARAGRAVVTNNGSDTASIVDMSDPTAPKIIEGGNITTGKGPLGVAINQDTGVAVVTNTQSNSITLFDAVAGGAPVTVGSSRQPMAVSIDPTRNVAVVASSQDGLFDVFGLNAAGATPSATLRGSVNVGGFGGNPLPTSVAFDAATNNFYGSGSLGNQIFVFTPEFTSNPQSAQVGINPTSLAYNFQSSTLVTVNTAGKTISVVDSQTFRTAAVLGIGVSPVTCSTDQALAMKCAPPSAVDIHPRTNLAVIADQAGNRILLLPLPH